MYNNNGDKMKIDDIYVNYKLYNEMTFKHTIVLLHGWGQNTEMMEPLVKNLIDKINIVNIDLPGFGKSEEPKEVWTIDDYVLCVNKLLTNLKVTNPILIGHSFGGRIAISYASKYQTNKLVLCSSPFMVRITKQSLKVRILKKLKNVPVLNKLENVAKKMIGSTDYKNASVMMRNILVNTVNTSLEEEVKKISCSTILIWGELDNDVTVEEGKKLESLLLDGALIVYPGSSHYAYLEDIVRTNNIIENFIKEELK